MNVHQKLGIGHQENGQSFFYFSDLSQCVKYLAREPFSDALRCKPFEKRKEHKNHRPLKFLLSPLGQFNLE